MMKVVAVNSSPEMDKGHTALVLNPFIEGMENAGAKVSRFYTKKLNIKPCSGEFKCWGEGDGRCYIRDDMDKVLPELRDAEIWVLGIPLYVPMPGEMQNLINRTMPLLSNVIDVHGRRMFPQRRPDLKVKKLALVSSCAFWEMENFDKLVWTIEETAEALGTEFAGALLRPHAIVMKSMMTSGQDVSSVVRAASNAGSELVKKGKISAATLEKVSAPLVTFEEYLDNFA